MPRVFAESLFRLERPCECDIHFQAGYDIAEMRNGLASRAVSGGYTHVLMLDLDMAYPPNTLSKLLEADKDIVGGFYLRRHQPPIPFYFKDTGVRYQVQPTWPTEIGVLSTAAIPGGGILIRSEVFQKIRPPHFTFGKKMPDGTGIGEDIYFSQRARDAGYTLWCHTGLIYGHLTELALTPIYNGEKWTCEYLPVH